MAILDTTTVIGNISVTGQIKGHGAVPIGGIVACSVTALAPGSGVIDANGFMLCDGATVPSYTGTGITSGLVLPDLTPSRFLRFSNTAGSVGGSNNITLAETNLPSHSHNMNNVSNHVHNSSNNDNHSHTINRNGHWGNGWTNYTGWCRDDGVSGSYSYGGNSPSHTHSSSNYGNHSHNLGNSGSSTSFDSTPKYFGVMYLIRVV